MFGLAALLEISASAVAVPLDRTLRVLTRHKLGVTVRHLFVLINPWTGATWP